MATKKKLPQLDPIPPKRYFPIREASDLCGVRDYVLRFWEKEFPQLRPMKRGKQRAYRQKDILIARRIRELVYGEGYKLSAARSILARELEDKARVSSEAVSPEVAASDASSSAAAGFATASKPSVTGAFSCDRDPIDLTELNKTIRNLENLLSFLHN